MNGTIHRWVGWIAVVAFVATGVWMRFRTPPMADLEPVVRFLYRANHVYLLLAGLVNVSVALNLPPVAQLHRPRLATAGSALLVIAPIVLAAAFLLEPTKASPVRPLTAAGIMLLGVGVVLHATARRRRAVAAP